MPKAVVLGGGDTLWTDLAQVPDKRTVIAVNDAGVAYKGRLDYWVTLHAEKLPMWKRQRSGNPDYITVSRHQRKGVDRVIPELWRGSSGLYAAQVALELEYDDIVLCGVPMTLTSHFFDNSPWEHCPKYRRGWNEALPELQGRVTSLSGWTRELLGPPAWAAPSP